MSSFFAKKSRIKGKQHPGNKAAFKKLSSETKQGGDGAGGGGIKA